MSVNGLPADGDWEAVNRVIRARMERLGLTVAGLSRASGVSETTIRGLKYPGKRTKSTLVAISAVLGYEPGYLVDVLLGEADPEQRASTGPDSMMTEMLAVLRSIEGKLDTLSDQRENPSGEDLLSGRRHMLLIILRLSLSTDVSSEYAALGLRTIDHARNAVHFSESALNEIDDARYSLSQENSVGVTVKLLSLSRQKTTSLDKPGAADVVDFALKRARRSGRKAIRDLRGVAGPGAVFDIEVADLRVGVMPFLYFGDYGEFLEGAGLVRVFWAQALVPPRRRGGKSSTELILLGSLNKVTNEPWSGTGESSLKIGFSYPSDPSVLSRLVSAELQLDSDPSVRKHIEDVEKY